MTLKAVEQFIGRGVVSDRFRELLTSRKMTREQIAAVNPELDPQDVNVIMLALMNTGDFPHFAAAIDEYLNRRYRGGRPAGDDLPISV